METLPSAISFYWLFMHPCRYPINTLNTWSIYNKTKRGDHLDYQYSYYQKGGSSDWLILISDAILLLEVKFWTQL